MVSSLPVCSSKLAIIIVSEASFLVSSMAQIFSIYIRIYLFQAVCRAKCFYVYLNIRPMQFSSVELEKRALPPVPRAENGCGAENVRGGCLKVSDSEKDLLPWTRTRITST